ncbi:hypothetical protein GOP47_0001283 [Adiantum capillus-veneris]|uniref:Uncharacterized protein n=1 Tax=Adiantum capillus-veneris TaxID=13818 RepID=A0A9D4V7Y6_ADICA|nr:hypothetical protein GOP47_0001283 [Adiantum capillus-veneris]
MAGKDDFVSNILERKVPTLPTIPADQKLDGKNYSLWKAMMEAVLESYDLLEMVEGDLERTPVLGDGLTTTEITRITKAAAMWDGEKTI